MAERTKEMVYAELLEEIQEYNEQKQSGRFEETGDCDKKIQELKAEYGKIVRTECFNELAKADNPMVEAVKVLIYDTIRVKDTYTEDANGKLTIPVRIIEPTVKEIDLLQFHNHMRNGKCKGIGADTNWQYYIEKLNYLMTAKVAEDIDDGKPGGLKATLDWLNSS